MPSILTSVAFVVCPIKVATDLLRPFCISTLGLRYGDHDGERSSPSAAKPSPRVEFPASTAILDGIGSFGNSGNSTVRKIDFVGKLVDNNPRRPIWRIVFIVFARSLWRIRVLAW